MLFDKKIDPSCSYCKYGSTIGDGEVVCIKRGVIPAWHSCRRFSYDPLKRIPPRPQMLSSEGFEKKDFEL